MDSYLIIPIWNVVWLAGYAVAEVALRYSNKDVFRSLFVHFRVWQLSLFVLSFFAFTLYDKTSFMQTLILAIGPLLSLLPLMRFFLRQKN